MSTKDTYMKLYIQDYVDNGRTLKQLNRTNPNATVCPECCIDDFVHVEDCTIYEELKLEMEKI